MSIILKLVSTVSRYIQRNNMIENDNRYTSKYNQTTDDVPSEKVDCKNLEGFQVGMSAGKQL